MATLKLQALWNHPTGPKTIHFWAPTFKWGISIANIADFAKPTDKISYPQQLGTVTCTGVIWSRYSMVITPKNWNLFSVNVAMAGTGIYQLSLHFWAPTFKWGISIANIADFAKPTDKISYPQQLVVTCSGVIWFRYGMVITPKNWNLSSVNLAMAGTGICQLARKIKNDFASEVEPVVAKE
ncbi:hypothetical protein HID58_041419 [Brassica napus]|uniref:Mitochondrial pyruvate carrier n=1 Tax=Brassica napus TaxID=3708 RepID=A0ABQ8BAU3_BRANA|nr:hypothetical protein HID58_041419 [Brassica napus]